MRLPIVDATAHVVDLKRYRSRGHRMAGNRIRLVTDRSMETVEVHLPSANSREVVGVTMEYYPPRPSME